MREEGIPDLSVAAGGLGHTKSPLEIPAASTHTTLVCGYMPLLTVG